MNLYDACKRYVTSSDYADEHPEDPYGGDELDYCEDMIREVLESRER